MRLKPFCLTALAALASCGCRFFEASSEAGRWQVVGPMVGAVTPAEAAVWAYAGDNPDLEIRWQAEGEAGAQPSTRKLIASRESHFAAAARLAGLKPGTTYGYQVFRNGKTDENWRGSFSTPPPEGAPARFKMAVSSCMNVSKQPVQPSWYLMLAERPAFHLLLGDNVYANTCNREELWQKHLEQRRVEEFAAVIRTVPTYAVWDDHDYGVNNSDRTEQGKDESLKAFRELFANPGYGTPEAPGVFFRFTWGEVEFFMLDVRYYRSPDDAPDDEKKEMLGEAQFRWLEEGLKASRSRFKVIASGSTLQASASDGWRLYDAARRRLYRAVMGGGVSGALFLSGDVHRCGVEIHESAETGGYPLYEIISSGIANSQTKGFAVLEFDTTLPDPTARLRIIHGDATVRYDRTVRLSELKIGSP